MAKARRATKHLLPDRVRTMEMGKPMIMPPTAQQ